MPLFDCGAGIDSILRAGSWPGGCTTAGEPAGGWAAMVLPPGVVVAVVKVPVAVNVPLICIMVACGRGASGNTVGSAGPSGGV